jgi:predicted nuclease of predicted toxin-antitoxin system
LKFLVDVGVGRVAERWLEMSGFDVKSVRAINPKLADPDILTLAAAEDRLVITMDKDFGELVYRSGRHHAGVLLLRMEDADGEAKRAVLEAIVSQHSDEIRGKFSVYQSGRLRVRKQA